MAEPEKVRKKSVEKREKREKPRASAGERPRLRQRYFDEVIPNMMKQFSFTNPFQVPRLEKIVVNVGAGEALQDSKVIDGVMNDLAVITGQQPIVRKARKSIAGFKLRKGVSVGAKVTLRGDRMYEFLDRLISVVVPRIRDFRGFERKSFDGAGNYTLGLDEQLVFPEIDYDKVDQVRGMNITMVTTARNDAEGLGLLENFGFPLKEKR